MPSRTDGFAVLVVLALLAVVGLYTAATLQNSLFGTVLAGSRVQQQQAFVLADAGLQRGLEYLASDPAAGDHSFEVAQTDGFTATAIVSIRKVGEEMQPGFSAGRFVVQHYEIESTATAARGRSVQVQGMQRIAPLGTP